jgi:crotonobetainyl-CoA:carnitine CoA-transferase CaiB-like acyl-CoA transferase
MFSGLLGFQAIATSLYARREQTEKKGRYIELSLMQGGAMLSVIRLIANYLEHGVAQRTSMPNGVFNSVDGQINITMVRPTDWRPFCEAVQVTDLLEDPRFSSHSARATNLDELYTVLRPRIARHTTAWLSERLTERGIMNGRVNSYEEFLKEEQVAATGIMAWLQQPGVAELVPMPNIPGLPPFVSGTKRAHAPTLGENSREVLAEHGYTEAEIERLTAKKIIAGR